MALNRPQKKTFVYSMKGATGSQSMALFKFFATLGMSVNDIENAGSIDLGVTYKFSK